MPNIKLSVIIPCYNHGEYIMDALKSLENIDTSTVEIIIVNDGSTDNFTNELLRKLTNEHYHVIFQKNMGLGEARNHGIREAKGKYILPLDADNKINIRYIDVGIEIMDNDQKVAVVYGNAVYFGEKNGELKPGDFNLQKIMLGNYIDACAVIRKSAIEEVGYYDCMKIMGLEDWDLWLRLAFNGYKFKYVDETLFYYRELASSMMKSVNRDIAKQNDIERYFIAKYSDKLDFDFIENRFLYKLKRKPFNFLYRHFLKKFFPSRYSRLLKQNKMYIGHLYGRI